MAASDGGRGLAFPARPPAELKAAHVTHEILSSTECSAFSSVIWPTVFTPRAASTATRALN
jgi:hypothetical protein